MFETCNSLTDLNKMKIATIQGGADVVTVNNAYNKRRLELLKGSKTHIAEIKKTIVKPKEVKLIAGIPIAGRSNEPNVIKVTRDGIFY